VTNHLIFGSFPRRERLRRKNSEKSTKGVLTGESGAPITPSNDGDDVAGDEILRLRMLVRASARGLAKWFGKVFEGH